jgi:hypothetical protein
VQDITAALARYFGEGVDSGNGSAFTWESFFLLFADFMQLFSKAEQEIAAQEQAKADEARRKATQAALKARALERRASNMHMMGQQGGSLLANATTPMRNGNSRMSLGGDGFISGDAFDFGATIAAASSAMDARRHTICNIMSDAPAAAQQQHSSAGFLSPSVGPTTRRRSGGNSNRLGSVTEDGGASAMQSPTRTSARTQSGRTVLGDHSAVLNSPLRSPAGVKRPAGADRDDGVLASPSKQARLNATQLPPLRAPNLAAAIPSCKENP